MDQGTVQGVEDDLQLVLGQLNEPVSGFSVGQLSARGLP